LAAERGESGGKGAAGRNPVLGTAPTEIAGGWRLSENLWSLAEVIWRLKEVISTLSEVINT
jgi:hypothetical protein